MKNVLILTSSGGNGLVQAAQAKKQEVEKQDKNAQCTVKDLLMEGTWLGIGKLFVNIYNASQKKGNIFWLENLLICQRAAEAILCPQIFVTTLRTLWKKNIDQVIDTQCLNTRTIVRAVRLYNTLKKKDVRVEKVLVDLPTKLCTHFFRPIKKLSKNDRKIFRLSAVEPLLEGEKNNEEFWQKHCRLSESQIIYEKYPIRLAFKEYMNKYHDKRVRKILIRAGSEKDLMQKTFQRGRVAVEPDFEGFVFDLRPEDKLYFIVLGSQPSKRGTYSYVKHFLELMQKKSISFNIALFVYCPQNILEEVSNLVANFSSYPEQITVIPIRFQKEDVIASLFFYNDWTITRSGGQTAMELMAVSKGKIWIHSESDTRDPQDTKALLKGIPAWEKGNAVYLKKKFHGGIITPSLLESYQDEIFN